MPMRGIVSGVVVAASSTQAGHAPSAVDDRILSFLVVDLLMLNKDSISIS